MWLSRGCIGSPVNVILNLYFIVLMWLLTIDCIATCVPSLSTALFILVLKTLKSKTICLHSKSLKVCYFNWLTISHVQIFHKDNICCIDNWFLIENPCHFGLLTANTRKNPPLTWLKPGTYLVSCSHSTNICHRSFFFYVPCKNTAQCSGKSSLYTVRYAKLLIWCSSLLVHFTFIGLPECNS